MESSGESLTACIQELEKMLGKKNTFEEAAKKLTILMEQEFSSASEQEQLSMYSAVCRAATLLRARYTSRGFWSLGERLFEASSRVVSEREQLAQVQKSLHEAQQFLGEIRARDEAGPDQEVPTRPESHLFEGQLTSGVPPPAPAWLVHQLAIFEAIAQEQNPDLSPWPTPPSSIHTPPAPPPTRPPPPVPGTEAAEPAEAGVPDDEAPQGAAGAEGGRSQQRRSGGGAGAGPRGEGEGEGEGEGSEVDPETEVQSRLARLLSHLRVNTQLQDLMVDDRLEAALEASLLEAPASYNARPPASKAEVEKLPVIEVTEEWLAKETEAGAVAPRCTICLEDIAVADGLQELPCHHRFHPTCIREWFSSRNSCPLCMNELPTDDVEYERAKVRALEEEEERKGVENALREGECMYI